MTPAAGGRLRRAHVAATRSWPAPSSSRRAPGAGRSARCSTSTSRSFPCAARCGRRRRAAAHLPDHLRRGVRRMAWSRDRGGAPPDLTIRDGARVTRHLYGRQRRNGEIIFGGDRELARLEHDAGSRGHRRQPRPRHRGAAVPLRFADRADVGRAHALPARRQAAHRPYSRPRDLWIVERPRLSRASAAAPWPASSSPTTFHTGTPAPVLAEADPAALRPRAHA